MPSLMKNKQVLNICTKSSTHSILEMPRVHPRQVHPNNNGCVCLSSIHYLFCLQGKGGKRNLPTEVFSLQFIVLSRLQPQTCLQMSHRCQNPIFQEAPEQTSGIVVFTPSGFSILLLAPCSTSPERCLTIKNSLSFKCL